MARLRECLQELGFQDVRTYVQSGNAVFRAPQSDPADLAHRIETALAREFGFEVPTVVVTAQALRAIIAANPFPEVESEPTHLVVVFLPQVVSAKTAAAFDLSDFPERGKVDGQVLYLHYPDGQGRSKLLPSVLGRRLGGTWGTARNWRTVTTLLALCAEPGDPVAGTGS
jgi:uncharacterized protein (DUF1697 family)